MPTVPLLLALLGACLLVLAATQAAFDPFGGNGLVALFLLVLGVLLLLSSAYVILRDGSRRNGAR
jgi:hypothetical protein